MKYQKINIESILIDHYPLNPKTLAYAKRLENGTEPPPIRVVKRQDGLFEVRDGRHRVCAHLLNGRNKIRAKFKEEPIPEKHHRSKSKMRQKGIAPKWEEVK